MILENEKVRKEKLYTVDYLHTQNYASDRFLFSDMIRENSVAQAKLREIARAK